MRYRQCSRHGAARGGVQFELTRINLLVNTRHAPRRTRYHDETGCLEVGGRAHANGCSGNDLRRRALDAGCTQMWLRALSSLLYEKAIGRRLTGDLAEVERCAQGLVTDLIDIRR